MTAIAARLPAAIPATFAAIANLAAYILDPDTGGDRTFTPAYTADLDGTLYYCADIPCWPLTPGEYPQLDALGFTTYADVLRSRNPDIWQAVLMQLATERGRLDAMAQLPHEALAELCAAMRFDGAATEGVA